MNKPYWAIKGQQYSEKQIKDFVCQMNLTFLDDFPSPIQHLEVLAKTVLAKFDKVFSVDEIELIIKY